VKRVERARAGGRTGLTILEVIVSLAVGSVALLGATTLFLGLSGKAQWLAEQSISEDREGNGDRVLRSVAANLTVNRLGTAGLVGDSTQFRFSSWCDAPWGGAVACTVSLTARADFGRRG
jgi:Tfp pilus assembly protein PilW